MGAAERERGPHEHARRQQTAGCGAQYLRDVDTRRLHDAEGVRGSGGRWEGEGEDQEGNKECDEGRAGERATSRAWRGRRANERRARAAGRARGERAREGRAAAEEERRRGRQEEEAGAGSQRNGVLERGLNRSTSPRLLYGFCSRFLALLFRPLGAQIRRCWPLSRSFVHSLSPQHTPSHSPPLPSSLMAQLQATVPTTSLTRQQQLALERDIIWRDVSVAELEREVVQVGELFNDFAKLVDEQDHNVKAIVDNIENSVVQTRAGVQNLQVAHEQQQNARSLTAGLLAIMASAAVVGGGALAGVVLLA